MGYVVVVALIALFFVLPAWFSFRREEAEARKLLAAAVEAGRRDPVTIAPWVNPALCVGSGSCVAACPEGDVLKVVDGRAQLVNGASCVGHGACAAACPMSAIELRFGSERRGVDLPTVGPDFQTRVDGLFVAGELGGMGLVANAARQGAQAVGYVAAKPPPRPDGGYDLVIVGGGPAGIGASLAAKQAGLAHLVLEQEEFGGAIRHFPRNKVVMTHGLALPGRPKIPASTLTKEELVALLTDVVREEGLPIAAGEAVTAVKRRADGAFDVVTSKRTVPAGRVILAVGRRGTPRRLDVPGETLEKVAYRLLDADQVRHAHVLVVGGGDSALEAAIALAASPGNRVTVAHRGTGFERAKAANRAQIEAMIAAGAVTARFSTEVVRIDADRVTVRGPTGDDVLANDLVYVFAGGVLPTQLLVDAGVEIARHFGDRIEIVG